MKLFFKILLKFDQWFTRNFWFFLTNGRKVESRAKLWKSLDVGDPKVYQKAKPLMQDSEHFIC